MQSLNGETAEHLPAHGHWHSLSLIINLIMQL
uniref:Uncharacterized protein n=1 Tax=Anguilla anguilla TaxID=7936 RepID=A0A0E9S219_ANGAN